MGYVLCPFKVKFGTNEMNVSVGRHYLKMK